MKKFTKITESLKEKVLNSTIEIDTFKEKLVELVEETTQDGSFVESKKLMEDFIESPEETSIMGLINDNDIYDLFVEYGDEINIVLMENDHFDKSPADLGVSNSLYYYVIESTRLAAKDVFQLIIDSE